MEEEEADATFEYEGYEGVGTRFINMLVLAEEYVMVMHVRYSTA